MLTSGTESLDNILNDGKSKSDKKGLDFSGQSFDSGKSTKMVFVRQIVKIAIKKKQFFQELIWFIEGLHRGLKKYGLVIFAVDLAIYYHFVIACMSIYVTLTEGIMEISTEKIFLIQNLSMSREWREKTGISIAGVPDIWLGALHSSHNSRNTMLVLLLLEMELKGKVLGKENISKPSLPNLQNVRLVKGLSTNWINISQLCNESFFFFFVRFCQDKCEVLGPWQKYYYEMNSIIKQSLSLGFWFTEFCVQLV